MIVQEYKIQSTTIKVDDCKVNPQEGEAIKNAICNIFKKIQGRYRSGKQR